MESDEWPRMSEDGARTLSRSEKINALGKSLFYCGHSQQTFARAVQQLQPFARAPLANKT
jgi:hypothetical protein